MYTIKFWTSHDTGLSLDEVKELYEIGAADGTLDIVAYDCPRLSPGLFETFVRRLDKIGFFAGVYGDQDRPVGFFFLSCFEGDTARIHFCLFNYGMERRHEIGDFVLETCFNFFKLKTLIGLVPVINQGAANYCLEMGGRKTVLIPGACWIARLRRSVGGLQYLFFPRASAKPLESAVSDPHQADHNRIQAGYSG
ncbi:hypothetical protein C4J81_11565 [Deltaproteobacteria bacterium Smac51]|nr:hypothetical protein C4J81_11565 [Deltaproteobacteria bacterium Smac51]